jgi:hypothetical protein
LEAVMTGPFGNLKRGYYGAILIDAPTRFETYDHATSVVARDTDTKSATMSGSSGWLPAHSVQVFNVSRPMITAALAEIKSRTFVTPAINDIDGQWSAMDSTERADFVEAHLHDIWNALEQATAAA